MPTARRGADAVKAGARVLTGLVVLIGIPGCDVTEPEPEIEVHLTTSVQARSYALEDPPYFSCTVTVEASATGDEGARATWGEANMGLFGGPDRSEQLWEIRATAGEVENAFGAPDIGVGEKQYLEWEVSADRPFQGRLRHEYRSPAGDHRAATQEFDCGPVPGEGGSPVVEVSFSRTGVTPGGTLRIDLDVGSEVGLWWGRIFLTGVWSHEVRLEPEPGVRHWSAGHEVDLPRTLALGERLGIQVEAWDLAGQRTVTEMAWTEPLADTRPPDMVTWPVNLLLWYAPGDTLTLGYQGWDASPRWMITTVGYPPMFRDSIRLGAGTVSGEHEIVIQDGWTGVQPVDVAYRDTLGNEARFVPVADVEIVSGK
jgi:hypothetical protein